MQNVKLTCEQTTGATLLIIFSLSCCIN